MGVICCVVSSPLTPSTALKFQYFQCPHPGLGRLDLSKLFASKRRHIGFEIRYFFRPLEVCTVFYSLGIAANTHGQHMLTRGLTQGTLHIHVYSIHIHLAFSIVPPLISQKNKIFEINGIRMDVHLSVRRIGRTWTHHDAPVPYSPNNDNHALVYRPIWTLGS